VPVAEGGAATTSAWLPALGPEGRTLLAFREELGQPLLEPGEDFFAAGGNSLMAAAVAARLGVPAGILAAFPSARKLAAHVRAGDARWTGLQKCTLL